MPVPLGRRRSRVPYWIRFSVTIASLGVITAAFVLVVLPQRFVLQAGLVESGITFPTRLPPFETPPPRPVVQPRMRMTVLPEPIVGPAERLWSLVLPLLRAGDFASAETLFGQYLAEHPEDVDVWREYAVLLTRAGRLGEAEVVYRRLVRASDAPDLMIDLARVLRDQGKTREASSLYARLVAASPGDMALKHEYAQALAWSEDYASASRVYYELLDLDPGSHQHRLELGKILYWSGRLADAHRVLSAIPESAPEGMEARQLRDSVGILIATPLPPGETLVQQARRAVASGDLDRANAQYLNALGRTPNDPEVWLEWANFAQYERRSLPDARAALLRVERLRGLERHERFRLAQLYAWTDQETEAKAMLVTLLEEEPQHGDAWTLLADLYRWEGSRLAARSSYRKALTISPSNAAARHGLQLTEQQAEQLVASREQPGVGPEFFLYRDSDGFRRYDFSVRASWQWRLVGMVARGGYRTIDGTSLSGAPGTESGPFLEIQLHRWWRLGTIRTSVTAGLEQLEAFGTEPRVGARLEIPDAGGTALAASYEHGPAFHRTVTLESVQDLVRSDHVEATAFRQLGQHWSIAGLGAVTGLFAGGHANWRINASVTVRRQLTTWLATGATSQLSSFGQAAPASQSRRLYWDPIVFWSNGIPIELRATPGEGWEVHGQLTPGIAVVHERTASGVDVVPQLGTRGGARYARERLSFGADLVYLRGREGDYNSFGATATLSIRP